MSEIKNYYYYYCVATHRCTIVYFTPNWSISGYLNLINNCSMTERCLEFITDCTKTRMEVIL